MSWTSLLLLLFLQGDPAPSGDSLRLDVRMEAALNELAERDPEVFRELRQGLAEGSQEARTRLEQHATYLDELELAKNENPRRHALLVEQQTLEYATRSALRDFHESLGEAERVEARAALRSRLGALFELRQQLRALQIEELQARYEGERSRVDERASDPRTAREAWLERIGAEGGSDAVGEPEFPEDLEALAPAIVRAIMRRDRIKGRRLVEMSERSPFVFRRTLRKAISEHPQLLEEARRARSDQPFELEDRMRNRVRWLQRRIGPFAREGRAVLPPEEREALDPALQEVVEAEIAISRFHLGRVEARLAELRETLAFRQKNRDVIVDLRLADLTGERERYEW